ncbi:Phage integrase family protein [Roseovarius pacificus]|uniref:Phage integrase family protein n=2 Tax=Roseovarius pacificus TaxID=337701 RepID=A0A1M7FTZ6_9RHOB|nr:hypothetical protein GCM10011315_31490 [Roseovarius pacificus]SHM07513.1 Phage integrase family protein [Roseovarius pacificus]
MTVMHNPGNHYSCDAVQMDLATAKTRFSAGVCDEYWAETRRLKIRGSVNKALKVYNAMGIADAEELILCDPDEPKRIYAEIKKTGHIPRGCNFKSLASVKVWASNLSAFFDVVSGRRATINVFRSVDDDWAALIDHVVGRNQGPVLLNTYERLPLNILARECRLRGFSLRELTSLQIEGFARDLLPNIKGAVKRGAKRLDKLRDDDRVPNCLLPIAPIGTLGHLTAAHQRSTPPMHPDLEAALEDYLDRRRRGEQTVEYGTKSRSIETDGISNDRAKNIATAVRWYWHGAVELGLVSSDRPFDREAFTQPEVLADVVKVCAEGGLGPICQPDVRRAHANSVIQFLSDLCPLYRGRCQPSLFHARSLRRRTEEESATAAYKRELCLRFIDDENFQRQFFSMPKVFFDEAKPLIAGFDALKNSNEPGLNKAQHRALDLAIMAVHTVIATRYPLRLATRQRLLSGGSQPHVVFPEHNRGEKELTILVPGHIVKNGYFSEGVPLLETRAIFPREIFEWYLKTAHPLILKHKPPHAKYRQPNALFCGLHIETLRRIWRNYTSEIGLNVAPHMCRHIVASHLYANGVPVCQIAELLGDTEATVRSAYMFVDRARQLRDVMQAQATIYRRLGV